MCNLLLLVHCLWIFLLNCNWFLFYKRAKYCQRYVLNLISLHTFSLTPFQFTPMARVPSLFFSQSHFRECQFLDLDRFAPQRARFTRHYYSQLSTLQTCHCSPVRHWASVSHEIGRDRHRWAGARRRPARVSDYPDRDLSPLKRAARTRRAEPIRASAFNGDFYKSIARNAGRKSNVARTPRAPPIKRR